MNELLARIKKDLMKELVLTYKKMSIVQIIPTFDKTYNPIQTKFIDTLNDICTSLNIDVFQEYISSTPYDLYADSRDIIDSYNINNDVTGIMYNYPFNVDKFYNTIKVCIDPIKDIECITPINIGNYILKQQYESIPPILSSIELLINEYCNENMKSKVQLQDINVVPCAYLHNYYFEEEQQNTKGQQRISAVDEGGDIIKVNTSKLSKGPNKDWLNFVPS